MPYFIYSSETLPNPEMMGKSGYTPEWFVWNGIQLPVLEMGKWQRIPDNFYNIRHKDWRDRSGTREHIAGEDIAARINEKWGRRGVIAMDHEPSGEERKKLEGDSLEKNMAFRMTVIEGYENAVREKEVTGKGRTTPTPYEDECYGMLGLTKPYSVEAMRAQRHPGEAVGEQMVAALERLFGRLSDQKAGVTPALQVGPQQPKAGAQKGA